MRWGVIDKVFNVQWPALGVHGYVSARSLTHLEGVDDVAEGLGHLAAVLVAHHGVEVHRREGQSARELWSTKSV